MAPAPMPTYLLLVGARAQVHFFSCRRHSRSRRYNSTIQDCFFIISYIFTVILGLQQAIQTVHPALSSFSCPVISCPAFSCPANWSVIFMSCMFMFCNLVFQFQVLHFSRPDAIGVLFNLDPSMLQEVAKSNSALP